MPSPAPPVTGAAIIGAAVVSVGIIAVSVRVAPAPWVAPAPKWEATKTADEDDIIKVVMLMVMVMPVAAPSAGAPVLATTPCAHSVVSEGPPASRGHRSEMIATARRGCDDR